VLLFPPSGCRRGELFRLLRKRRPESLHLFQIKLAVVSRISSVFPRRKLLVEHSIFCRAVFGSLYIAEELAKASRTIVMGFGFTRIASAQIIKTAQADPAKPGPDLPTADPSLNKPEHRNLFSVYVKSCNMYSPQALPLITVTSKMTCAAVAGLFCLQLFNKTPGLHSFSQYTQKADPFYP
jgi:hypothetical protein